MDLEIHNDPCACYEDLLSLNRCPSLNHTLPHGFHPQNSHLKEEERSTRRSSCLVVVAHPPHMAMVSALTVMPRPFPWPWSYSQKNMPFYWGDFIYWSYPIFDSLCKAYGGLPKKLSNLLFFIYSMFISEGSKYLSFVFLCKDLQKPNT
jgi:hypothetical protein